MSTPISEKFREPKEVPEAPTSPETAEAALHNVEPANPMEVESGSGEQVKKPMSNEPTRPYEVPPKPSELTETKPQPVLNQEILAKIIENQGLERKGVFDPSALQATLEQAMEQEESSDSDNDDLLKAA